MVVVVVEKREETANRKVRGHVGWWPRVWVTTVTTVGHHPVVVLPIVPSDDDHTHTHTQTNKKTKECKPCLLGLAKPYEECCVCVKLGKEMIGNEKEKKRKKENERPTRKPVAFVAVK